MSTTSIGVGTLGRSVLDEQIVLQVREAEFSLVKISPMSQEFLDDHKREVYCCFKYIQFVLSSTMLINIVKCKFQEFAMYCWENGPRIKFMRKRLTQ